MRSVDDLPSKQRKKTRSARMRSTPQKGGDDNVEEDQPMVPPEREFDIPNSPLVQMRTTSPTQPLPEPQPQPPVPQNQGDTPMLELRDEAPS